MNVVRIKKGDQIKNISKLAWEMMADNKQGWSEVSISQSTVSNEVPPPSGDKVVDNSKVENEVKSTNETVTTVSNEVPPHITADSEFVELAKKSLTRTALKDYLDQKEVQFKQTDSLEILSSTLAIYMKNNIELLKSEFGL